MSSQVLVTALQGQIEVCRRGKARSMFARLPCRRRLAEEEHDLLTPAGAHLDHGLQGRAGVEAGANSAGRTVPSLEEMPDDRACRSDPGTPSDRRSTRFGAR